MAGKNKAGVLAAMAAWTSHQGITPFASADASHAVDRCDAYLGNAACILSMLAAAGQDSQVLLDAGQGSEFDLRRGDVLAGALEGVASLINLAAFILDDGQ